MVVTVMTVFPVSGDLFAWLSGTHIATYWHVI